jgi:hypothetical protein
MDTALRDEFIHLWQSSFDGAELPITFEIGGEDGTATKAPVPKGWQCLICSLIRVRKGTSLTFDESSLSCSGAKFYTGYETARFPDFRYFLSYGKPGGVKGERYKRTPEIVDEADKYMAPLPSKGKSITFKRWDRLTAADNPDVVIFFARGEVLSGLFTLANFDQVDPNGVMSPFGAGCGSIIHYPYLEQQKDNPKAVLGMFDPSARPCVGVDILTMAIPMKKFAHMISYMGESFLITPTWETVKKKIARSNEIHFPK